MWTRANTGANAPSPDKGLRYAACVVSRGYLAELFYVPVADPAARSLDGVPAPCHWLLARLASRVWEPTE